MYYERLDDRTFSKLENTLHIYEKRLYQPVGALAHAQGLTTQAHFRAVPAEGFAPIEPGTSWGGEWQNLWVKGDFTVPAELDGQALYLLSDCGGCEQLFFLNGEPKGLFNTKNKDYIGGNHAAQYLGVGKAGETLQLAFECYAGHFCVDTDPYDNYDYPDIPAETYSHVYNGATICTRDEALFTLLFDLRELLGAATTLPEQNFLRGHARRALREIAAVLPRSPRHATPAAVREGISRALEMTRPFFTGGNSRIFGRVGIIGHSHMDTAWLWPVAETVRKCARTYANALHLMERYPTYNFMQSSALHGEWMKLYYPTIFAEMQKRVAEGRYEPNGGVYVECDCNITSGELMARQFLKGQQFTRENFNYTADCFWLPDTFGYNANIPQIMLGSEVQYFYTTKIGWNELNKFPFESFVWKGIDGSEVLTHFSRTHCWPDVDDCAAAVRDLSLKDTTDLRLVAYGYGDGGGGPTDGMIETGLRACAMEGMPEIEPMTISAFMKELEAQREGLPVYHDELYLELHRGTLTQMHDVKRMNRKAEYALRKMEYFNVLAGQPRHAKSDPWLKTLLKNQFHDILPGTSITPVYDVYRKEMGALLADYAAAAADYAATLTDGSESVTLFNSLSFARTDPAVLTADGYAADYPSQRYTDLCGREQLAVGGLRLPGFGSATLRLSEQPANAPSPFRYDGTTLVTPFATLVFDENGYIASLTDRATGRELRKPGGAPLNVLLFGEDLPLHYDNWDVERDAVRHLQPVCGFRGRTVVTDGAVEIRLRSVFEIGDGTTLQQDLICYADTPRIDFHTLVDWQSPHRLLKAGFDLDVAAPTARCEIQFGAVQRPTTENTSLEVAKFEVCNRNYTDVSEPGFGAAVLNDCKYGITVTDCNLRLSLHRGGIHPDVTGDSGLHEMTYALLVHDGGFSAEAVVHPAYMLNIPIDAVPGKAALAPFASVSAPNVICETVKPAEDGSDAFVLRLYECEGTQTAAELALSVPTAGAVRTNLLEDEKETLPLENGRLRLHFRPFEIKTIKFTRK
ncbi:MAG: alpha-mannosidase [Clostridia bacterium]|nr:alpha-mannosidase [Clostridia bacterium]